jgi:hypothetical protein
MIFLTFPVVRYALYVSEVTGLPPVKIISTELMSYPSASDERNE